MDVMRGPRTWLVPLVIAAIQVVGSTGSRYQHPDTGWRALDWFAYLLLVAGPLALLARSRYPYAVLVIVLAVTVTYPLAGFGFGPIFISLVVAFLAAATQGPRWLTYPLPFLGWAAVMWGVPWIRGDSPPPSIAVTATAAWLLVLVGVAEAIRQRRLALEARRQRRASITREAQTDRERRDTEARLALARELHDVLAHSLSMINVQSSVALELLDEQPGGAGPALAAIKEASRQAISDVHSLVAALRTDAGVPVAPTSGVTDLDALVATARAAGLTVSTRVQGSPHALPAVLDVAAGRIVQEALTNVARHSSAAEAAVTVEYQGEAVDVAVEDPGPARLGATASGGTGIAGMRERVRALGGSLTAHTRADGSFAVRARLPLGGQ
ncbi:sensor histidine kinase [Mycobacteroides salmoniphilum]|uniref:sensor histidine kinase n=1 Tax=Mycobacteroides salmoniphilum TaxID=404941 RepID=UPI00099218C7|nr:sensor histidine kinase [Mycobacteroides salmoniphilum]